MDPFWTNVFDHFKDRRIAGVFYRTLLLLIVLLVTGIFLYPFLPYVLAVIAGLFLIWAVRSILQALARRRDRYKSSPLSRDELNKARSKLIRAK